MADVFVSYKSEDRERARLISLALQEEGFDVWWDTSLQAGEDYQEVIDRELRNALIVVVLWSPRSVASRWVRSEATIGDKYGALAPVMIETCDLPTAFVLVQTANLTQWRGDRNDPAWRAFAEEIGAKRQQRRTEKANHTAPAAPDSAAIEGMYWQSIKDSLEASDFNSYLRRYPNGHFADLARSRVKQLSGRGGSGWIAPVAIVAALAAAGAAAFALYPRFMATEVAGPEAMLNGRWAPAGLTCADAVRFEVRDNELHITYGATQGLEPIVSVTSDTVETEGASGRLRYIAGADTLIMRTPDGASASFDRCAG